MNANPFRYVMLPTEMQAVEYCPLTLMPENAPTVHRRLSLRHHHDAPEFLILKQARQTLHQCGAGSWSPKSRSSIGMNIRLTSICDLVSRQLDSGKFSARILAALLVERGGTGERIAKDFFGQCSSFCISE